MEDNTKSNENGAVYLPYGMFSFLGQSNVKYAFEGVNNLMKNELCNEAYYNIAACSPITDSTTASQSFASNKFMKINNVNLIVIKWKRSI
jgi:hypothetical protein